MNPKSLILALLLLVMAGCATAPPPPLNLTFLPERAQFISAGGERVSFHQALGRAADADFIILGEGHKNRCDHRIQQRVVRGLVELGVMPAVGLEMVPVDLAPVLERFNAGEIDPADMDRELDWKATWGYPYELFEPLFTLAREHGLPVFALNVPKSALRKLTVSGLDDMDETSLKYMPTRIIDQLPIQEEMLRASFAMHGTLAGFDSQVERFLLVQSVWESMMAEQAVAAHRTTDRPVVVVAGSGHVDRGWGIPRRVRLLEPGARVLTLVPVRDVYDFDPELGDLAFYCPVDYHSRMGMVLEVRQGRVTVVEVERVGRAAEAGIRPGDVLSEAQGRRVRSLMDLHAAGKLAHDTNKPLVFGLERHGELVHVNLGTLGPADEQAGEEMQ